MSGLTFILLKICNKICVVTTGSVRTWEDQSDKPELLGLDPGTGAGISLFITASKLAVGSTQPSIQLTQGTICAEATRLKREADHTAGVNDGRSFTSTPSCLYTGITLFLPSTTKINLFTVHCMRATQLQ
jgi:hypothetical protein